MTTAESREDWIKRMNATKHEPVADWSLSGYRYNFPPNPEIPSNENDFLYFTNWGKGTESLWIKFWANVLMIFNSICWLINSGGPSPGLGPSRLP